MGHRPTDWHILDLADDPTPGDPERVKQLARELHDFADDVADALRQIKGMAGEDALLRWAGKTAKAFLAGPCAVPTPATTPSQSPQR
ncbi:hypothetical protein OG946_32525 [Streptomyces sp. NBC_01808]|nr:hypothetical protein [Streptomyces sp. NBC_01808]WSA41683.1 hypothetical protein OG946_32525 [Streptomyces sp. NBC_01808]